MSKPRYQVIAETIAWIENTTTTAEWHERAESRLDRIMSEMPRGSGINCGTKLCPESTPDRLVFDVGFHHMDEHGSYDGWTEHRIIVTPSLMDGFDIRITGVNRNDIKEYLHQTFDEALRESIDPHDVRYSPWFAKA